MRTLLDLDVPPLADAERRLADLSRQRRARMLGTAGLAGLALAAELVMPWLGVVLLAGAVAALVTAAIARARRRALLSTLLQVRDAYGLEAVSREGTRFATRERRGRLAAWLRRIVMSAEQAHPRPGYTATALERRVLARKERLLAVAASLEDRDQELHPAGVAIVHRLLTRPSVSPLFNPALDELVLDDALHRIEACPGGRRALVRR
ncbi:MAG: hypothetical protein ACTHNU_17300 [Gaiellales bacterium]